MNPNEIQAVLAALEPIMTALAAIGLPGLLAAMVSAPALVIVAILVMSHVSMRRMEKAQTQFQENMRAMLEAYREDTQSIIRDAENRHAEVVQYYNKNVDLVKNYERTTDSLQSLVINNTRAFERLTTIMETSRQYS